MSQVAVNRKLAPCTLLFKAVLLAGLYVVWSLASHRGGKDFELALFYLIPFATALVVPPGLTDLAAGLSVGAAFAEAPATLFLSVFGGVLPDPAALRFMRIVSVVLITAAIAALIAYRREGESSSRFFTAGVVSVVYVMLLAAVSG